MNLVPEDKKISIYSFNKSTFSVQIDVLPAAKRTK